MHSGGHLSMLQTMWLQHGRDWYVGVRATVEKAAVAVRLQALLAVLSNRRSHAMTQIGVYTTGIVWYRLHMLLQNASVVFQDACLYVTGIFMKSM